MIKIENTDVFGWEAAVRGMRNPMNSWMKSDTYVVEIPDTPRLDYYGNVVEIIPAHKQVVVSYKEEAWNGVGDTDLSLMKKLVVAGSDDRKFMRYINVTLDVTAPLYWWKEFDTYKVGTVANSCSTMHKIHEKPFAVDDFSTEHLIATDSELFNSPYKVFLDVIICLNWYRELYIKTKDKQHWWQMIQLLPSSYNQRRTLQLNYEVLRNIYHARKNHKLDEWRDFCEWIERLPYSELITE